MEPIRILRWEGLVFVLALSALMVWRMLTREISLSGLLGDGTGDGTGHGQVSPERVQLLVMTIAVSFKVLGSALHGSGSSLPEVSPLTLGMFGASSGVYAAVKALKALRAR